MGLDENSPLDDPDLMELVAKFRKEANYPPAAVLGFWVDAPEGMPDVIPKPGSEKRSCEGCASSVWVGPEQLKVVNGPLESVIVCAGCALSLGLMGDDMSFTPLSDTSHELRWPDPRI